MKLQLEICLRQLGDPASEAITILTALEALARLCWNDDEVRAQVSMLDGEHSHTIMVWVHPPSTSALLLIALYTLRYTV